MPTETKNSTAKASRSGSDSSAARWLSSDSLEDHAGKEGAERERDAEQLGCADRQRPSAIARTASRNSSREPVWAT